MPEPLRTTNASDLPILSRIQNSSSSTPRLADAASPVEPMTPIGTSPDAIALVTSPPELNWRHLILYPVAFSKLPLAIAVRYGPTINWYATVTSLSSAKALPVLTATTSNGNARRCRSTRQIRFLRHSIVGPPLVDETDKNIPV